MAAGFVVRGAQYDLRVGGLPVGTVGGSALARVAVTRAVARLGALAVLVPALGAGVGGLAAPSAAAATAVAYRVSATIPVGDGPAAVAVDAAHHRLYVANQHGNSVSVVDTATNAVVTTVPVGAGLEPTALAIDFISSAPVVKAAAVGVSRSAITPPVFTPTTPYIYVANEVGKSVSVINGSTNTVVATIPIIGNFPEAIAIDTAAHRLYAVGDAESSDEGIVSVIDTTTNTVVGGATGGYVHNGAAADPTTHQVYATNGSRDSVSTVDPSSGEITGYISAFGTHGAAIDPTTHKLYVTSASQAGQVSVIDEGTNQVIGSIAVEPQPEDVAVDSAAQTVYVAHVSGGKVSVIDAASKAVVTTVAAGSAATGIAVDPTTHTAYVANFFDDTVTVISRASVVTRLAGADRFGTAVAVSQAAFPNGGAGAVVLARGDDYPDALVGAPLAKAKNAPLLLTSGASLPVSTKAELQRVLPAGGTVYVLGGVVAVPASVASEVSSMGYSVVRYSGANRYDTAVQVAGAVGNPGTVLLATGTNFPDALSAGVAAARAGGVVLLTAGATLPPETSAYLAAHGSTVYAVGGPAAAADPSATAIVGADRFSTAVAVAERFFSAPTTVGVATGLSFPDALSGGGLLARSGSPLVLVSSSSVPSEVASYLSAHKATMTAGYLFGGVATVSATVEDAIGNALVQ